MINFAELNKEQKQLLILSVGGVITLIMLGSNLLMKPANAAAAEAEELILKYEQDVRRGELLIRRDQRVRAQTQSDSKEILKIYQEQLPPEINRYGWALDNLIALSDKIDLEIFVKETREDRFIPERQGEKSNPESVPMWVPYSVDVEFRTNFANLKKFLNLIEKEFPFSSVANMQISSTDQDPENHFINFTVEWPVFRYDEDLDWIISQARGSEK